MKSKEEDPSIRVMGQRTIPSSFLFSSGAASNFSADVKEDANVTNKALLFNNNNNKKKKNSPRVSLSDFLDGKLQNASLLPKTVQGKKMPFSSRVNRGDFGGSILGKIGVKNGRETEVNCVLEEAVFKQFNYDKKENGNCLSSCSAGEVRTSDTDGVLETRKRTNPFEGVDEKASTLKHVVVLGADPKPKKKRREETFSNKKKPRPIYNHYGNGNGWWDCNMEGLDSDVGCSEGWEGMGSTTLGGLEWH